MSLMHILAKEKIVSLSELQRNPAKALAGSIVRIVKNGKEIGIFLSREEFEDLMEEQMEIKPELKKELEKRAASKSPIYPIEELFKDD